MLGVTNLRGVIVPLVDLRSRFGLEAQYGSGTVTVVLSLAGRTVGAVVDAVSDVVALAPAQVKSAPEFSGAIDDGHITGIATLSEGDGARMLILLDIQALMIAGEMGLAGDVAH